MLKHPLPARRDSLGVSNAPSASVLAAAAERALGDRYTTTASAEAVGSWIRRLSHVRVVPQSILGQVSLLVNVQVNFLGERLIAKL